MRIVPLLMLLLVLASGALWASGWSGRGGVSFWSGDTAFERTHDELPSAPVPIDDDDAPGASCGDEDDSANSDVMGDARRPLVVAAAPVRRALDSAARSRARPGHVRTCEHPPEA